MEKKIKHESWTEFFLHIPPRSYDYIELIQYVAKALCIKTFSNIVKIYI